MTTSKRTKMLVMLVFIVMSAVTMFVSPQAHAQQQQSSFGGVVEEPFAVVFQHAEALGRQLDDPARRRLAPDADACFVLECARANGDIVRDLGPSSAHEILEALELVTQR